MSDKLRSQRIKETRVPKSRYFWLYCPCCKYVHVTIRKLNHLRRNFLAVAKTWELKKKKKKNSSDSNIVLQKYTFSHLPSFTTSLYYSFKRAMCPDDGSVKSLLKVSKRVHTGRLESLKYHRDKIRTLASPQRLLWSVCLFPSVSKVSGVVMSHFKHVCGVAFPHRDRCVTHGYKNRPNRRQRAPTGNPPPPPK